MIDYTDAIQSLYPSSAWILDGDDYTGLVWNDPDRPMPTREELDSEIARLQQEQKNSEYQRLRAKEYPPVTDYLDAVVKGDLAQQQAYIDACLAVKAKYPKPEGV